MKVTAIVFGLLTLIAVVAMAAYLWATGGKSRGMLRRANISRLPAPSAPKAAAPAPEKKSAAESIGGAAGGIATFVASLYGLG